MTPAHTPAPRVKAYAHNINASGYATGATAVSILVYPGSCFRGISHLRFPQKGKVMLIFHS